MHAAVKTDKYFEFISGENTARAGKYRSKSHASRIKRLVVSRTYNIYSSKGVVEEDKRFSHALHQQSKQDDLAITRSVVSALWRYARGDWNEGDCTCVCVCVRSHLRAYCSILLPG